MRFKTLILSLLAAAPMVCGETVLLDENFDADWHASFPVTYDGDSQLPAYSIQALFLSPTTGYYMPWQLLRESSSSPDGFIGSHSNYSTPGRSDDWLVSKPLNISTEGFMLAFDAQSVVLRQGNRLSDLEIYISELPVGDSWQPTEPDFVFEQVPAGATADVTTDEWTHYSVPLDNWVGKTVYISFVNHNTDRDILCLDRVKVYRSDAVELTLDPLEQYTFDEQATVSGMIHAAGADVTAPVLTINGVNVDLGLETIQVGQFVPFQAVLPLAKDCENVFVASLAAEGIYPVEAQVSTTLLTHRTTRHVLLEETTGLWCSNCPRAIYNIEALAEDLGDRVLPVSVHISGGTPDYMAFDAYADNLGIAGIAPMVRLDRGEKVLGFTPAYDSKYDPTEPNSFACAVHRRTQVPAIFDLKVDGEWVINAAGDTTAVRATATVLPALTIADAPRYQVGFILTENNVGLDNNPFWVQENGVADMPFESALGGWTLLPRNVINMRYHFVARAITQFGGIQGSITEIKADEPFTVTFELPVPDTYIPSADFGMAAHAVRTKFCDITAYIVDTADKTIANAARAPLCAEPYELFTAAKLSSVAAVECDAPAVDSPVYDLTGRRVAPDPNHPLAPGIYISAGRKFIIR